MSTNSLPGLAELLQSAQDYQHNPNQHVVLDPYKDVVLLFRAKYATYDTITEKLREKGVSVSQATVRNFCRRHHEEMKRLRSELDRKRRENASAQPHPAKSASVPASDSPKQSSLPETNKPGPKIARDVL